MPTFAWTSRAAVLLGSVLTALSACSNGDDLEDPGPRPSVVTPSQPEVTPTPTPPEGPPVEPPPARRGMIEIDQMTGTRALLPLQTVGGNEVSLAKIYEDAGFGLRVVPDQQDLPRMDRVRLADLHGMMISYRSESASAGEWRFYALVATQEADRPDTLGIMFDFGHQDENDLPREAFAVFADAHEGLDAGADPELLLTTAHELAHCFNLHHPDWDGAGFYGGATVESYSTAADCIWALSAKSKDHLQNGPLALVMPGAGGLPFGLVTAAHLALHQPAPPEEFDVVDPTAIGNAARGRPMNYATAARVRDAAAAAARAAAALTLTITTPKDQYVVGEPVTLTLELANRSPQPVEVSPLLDVSYRFMQVFVRRKDEEIDHPFRPAVLRDARVSKTVTIPPNEAFVDESKVFFGAEGWTFPAAGEYVLTAEFEVPRAKEGTRLYSNALPLTITEPGREPDKAATARLRTPSGSLSKEAGLFLLFEGGDHLMDGAERVRKITEDAANSVHASAARLALGIAALNPTIQRGSRVAPPPRIDEAKALLADLIDSDLAAPAVARATEQLAKELEAAQRTSEAEELRRNASERFKDPKLKSMLERVRRQR